MCFVGNFIGDISHFFNNLSEMEGKKPSNPPFSPFQDWCRIIVKYHEQYFARYLKFEIEKRVSQARKKWKLKFEISIWVRKCQIIFFQIFACSRLSTTKSCVNESPFKLVRVRINEKVFELQKSEVLLFKIFEIV